MQEKLKSGDKFQYTDVLEHSQVLTYLGKKEIKEVLFEMFETEDHKGVFFYPSEIKPPMFVPINEAVPPIQAVPGKVEGTAGQT